MSKRKTTQVELETNVPNDDLSKLSEDQKLDLLEATFSALCARLETSGVDPEYITGVMFGIFVDRMAATDDRECFDEMLEEALQTPWEEFTLH
jgi:hypothetical protein